MKNHKLISLLLLLSGSSTAAVSAQMLVAGWDFSQYAAYSLVGENYDFTDNMYGNFSSLDRTGNYSGITGPDEYHYGTFYYGGQFGSSVMLQASEAFTRSITDNGSLTSNDGGANSEYYQVGFGNSQKVTFLTEEGQDFVNDYRLAFDAAMAGQSFVFEANVGEGNLGEDWSFSFAGMSSGGNSAIAWEYSLDGTSYLGTGVTSNLTALDTSFTVDLSEVDELDGVEQIFIRGTLSNYGAGIIPYLDNASISVGSISAVPGIPEPSTYAAFAGLLAGGLALLRRRQRSA
ncbi:MAG: PEP-CTERM sorting domain-containing protein [Verrucomicrobiota bacterium JB022]|nr:PEP-CTERM sorting domain-containing protein [Verrucomicrobiota bacterium JB022]